MDDSSSNKKALISIGLVVVIAAYAAWLRFGSSGTPVATEPTTPTTEPTTTSTTTTVTTTTTTTGAFKDGTYTGTPGSSIYGAVQVKAVIVGGKLTDVQWVEYPQDRGESLQISNRAMPILNQEAIAAQSANVNSVSGATQTAEAFNQSLAAALALAQN